MKHGDKAKSKAASKASGKKSSKASAKSSKAAGAKSSKASHAVQKHQATSSKTAKQSPAGKSHAAGDNGKTRLRVSPDELTFSNPIVSAAFKRAVKKYANAFRKLTD
ncbi:MAG: hypothetical protein ACXW29_01870 [Thermoanaerobaculia bacterium]